MNPSHILRKFPLKDSWPVSSKHNKVNKLSGINELRLLKVQKSFVGDALFQIILKIAGLDSSEKKMKNGFCPIKNRLTVGDLCRD